MEATENYFSASKGEREFYLFTPDISPIHLKILPSFAQTTRFGIVCPHALATSRQHRSNQILDLALASAEISLLFIAVFWLF